MEFTYLNNVIKLPNKELTILDRLVLDFISRVDIRYVIISGYVAILFGRSRNTEDVDIFIEDKGLVSFTSFYTKIILGRRYYSINAEDAKDAYELMRGFGSLRFAEKETFNPNFEIKFAKDETDFYSLNNPLTVDLGLEPKLKVSPLELEIPYKLYLGSEKDFADAAHLYTVFKEILDVKRLKVFLNDLNISKSVKKRVLGDAYE
jgi:hypothetical protein